MTLLPVLAGPALLVGAGYAVTVVVPATASVNTHRTVATRTYTKGALKGHALYAANGCVSCHTLARRDTFTDAGLGSATTGASEDLNDRPAMHGDARYGPDLSCVGDRIPGPNEDYKVAAAMAYLQDPAAVHHGTTMPSYRFLKTADLRQLAMFLVEHSCLPEATP
jgi:cbb3-type cytochrome oxidase cytochrome c subunit